MGSHNTYVYIPMALSEKIFLDCHIPKNALQLLIKLTIPTVKICTKMCSTVNSHFYFSSHPDTYKNQVS